MTAVSRFERDPHEPLALRVRGGSAPAARGDPGPRRFELEFSSRGDRVPCRLLLPPVGGGPFPLVLLQLGADCGADGTARLAEAGLARGAAVAWIELPLHGRRDSGKWGALLRAALARPAAADAPSRALVIDFVGQAVIDLRRALDALDTRPELDRARMAYAGFGLGGELGAILCGVDERPRAALLAPDGGGPLPEAVDAARFVAGGPPRPRLFLCAGPATSASRGERLFAAAPEPRQRLVLEASPQQLPRAARDAMWRFLGRHLALPEAAAAR